ncbi:SRPBCC family protein [Agilicoccus flavus]|uniref:SRPBCC family protein n=1 Tax=Agilicoccus flavus TaxID=2775968 RepID=UPI001CF70B8A|nr:SRPBCC family protein [Agilicoccus flavus]
MECNHTFEVAASPVAVWELVGDPTRWPEWMESVNSVTPKGDTTGPEHGALYKLRRAWDFAGDCRITLWRPTQEIAYVLSGSSVPASGRFVLSSDADGRCTVASSISLDAVTGVWMGLFGGGEQKVTDQLVADAVALRRLVEPA